MSHLNLLRKRGTKSQRLRRIAAWVPCLWTLSKCCSCVLCLIAQAKCVNAKFIVLSVWYGSQGCFWKNIGRHRLILLLVYMSAEYNTYCKGIIWLQSCVVCILLGRIETLIIALGVVHMMSTRNRANPPPKFSAHKRPHCCYLPRRRTSTYQFCQIPFSLLLCLLCLLY